MATIKEIAELAGVSRGTVDRVLNNRGEVNAETAARVMDIVKALDYRPNKAGLALAVRKKKYKIGVILFSANNPFFNEVMEGVSKKAKDLEHYGISTITRRIDVDVEQQLNAIDELLAMDINGLLIAPCNHPSIRLKIDEIVDMQIPVVTVNTDIEGSKRLAYVGSDYFQSGRTAAGLFGLLLNKPSLLGIVTGSSDVLCHTERIRGLTEVLSTEYPGIQIADIVENHDDEFESYSITKALLHKYPDMNAIFFTAGGVCGGCRAILESGRDLKVITFDDVPTTIDMLKKGVISITIGQQPLRQGSKSLDIMFEHLTAGILPKEDECIINLTMKIKENYN